jgi:hypothetical protein
VKTFASERRCATRLVTHIDAEVIASLAILDTEAAESDDELLFSGETTDISLDGLGIVLPSAPIDERFCTDVHQLTVRLHLPEGPVKLRLIPARCVSLQADAAQGYLLAGRIISSDGRYANYVKALSQRGE